MTISVRYFAGLREQAQRDREEVEFNQGSAADLYAALAGRHAFSLPVACLRVAVNGAFQSMDTPLAPGDEVVFIPPVAGG